MVCEILRRLGGPHGELGSLGERGVRVDRDRGAGSAEKKAVQRFDELCSLAFDGRFTEAARAGGTTRRCSAPPRAGGCWPASRVRAVDLRVGAKHDDFPPELFYYAR